MPQSIVGDITRLRQIPSQSAVEHSQIQPRRLVVSRRRYEQETGEIPSSIRCS